jgi:uncharacterized protein
MKIMGLLILSNVFMTIAWYWHLKHTNIPLWKVVVISWFIALFEYCLTVPANRMGVMTGLNGFPAQGCSGGDHIGNILWLCGSISG